MGGRAPLAPWKAPEQRGTHPRQPKNQSWELACASRQTLSVHHAEGDAHTLGTLHSALGGRPVGPQDSLPGGVGRTALPRAPSDTGQPVRGSTGPRTILTGGPLEFSDHVAYLGQVPLLEGSTAVHVGLLKHFFFVFLLLTHKKVGWSQTAPVP